MLLKMQKPEFVVRVWPDGSWVAVDDYEEYDWSHMSDDWFDIDLYDFDACAKHGALLRGVIEDAIGEDPIAMHE